MTPLHLAILTPFIVTPLIPVFYKALRRIHTGWFVVWVPLALFLYFLGFFPLPSTEPVVQSLPWIPQLGVEFAVAADSLSLLFALIITGMGTLVVLYSIFYLSKEREALHNFYVYLLLFLGSMLGVVLSDNLMVFYLFWEGTSISSFLLIAFWFQRQKSRQGAVKALLITVTGGFAMFLGFLMVAAATGTFSIREIIASSDALARHALFLPAMLLILLGAFTKSAQFPFYIWLPDAMEAPTPISAYLHSATMVKAGIYLVARLTPAFGGGAVWFWTIVIVGLVTLLWGSFLAVRQIDLKAMLAFSTVSQLGLIMSLLGIASLALAPGIAEQQAMLFAAAAFAAVFHLLNHSVFKGALFMVVGILDHELGTRDIRKLGGLMGVMPVSFTLTVIGAFSMAGLPPFGGFLSKELFFTGTLTAFGQLEWKAAWIPLVAWLASVFTFVYCMILVFKTFTGKQQPELLDKPPHEAPVGMLVPPVVLAALAVLFFFIPNSLARLLLEPAARNVLPGLAAPGEPLIEPVRHWHGLSPELLMTIAIVLIGTLLYRTLPRWGRIYDYLPRKWTLNAGFDKSLLGLEKLSGRLTRSYMTGYIRHYFMYIFGFMILLVGGSLVLLRALDIDLSGNAPIGLYEAVVALCIAAAAVFLLFSKSRLTSIISLSAVGLLVSLYYVIFRAPDLALTQLVVETISTTLFLLCFYFLPKLRKDQVRLPFKTANLLISLGVGLVFTLIGLSVTGHRVFEPISRFYENTRELAGADNIVNAILVDFRGFDTMLEIVVLFAAGIGVFTLTRFRYQRRNDL